GFIYLFTGGIKRIPKRRKHKQLTKGYDMQEYLTDVKVNEDSDLVGHTFNPDELAKKLDLDVLRIFKADSDSSAQRSKVKIEAGDVLRIRGSAGEIEKLLQSNKVTLKPSHEWTDTDLTKGRDALVEAAVSPDSSLSGATMES